MTCFDKNAPYGTCGRNIYGKRFYQNGQFFNCDGVLIDDNGNIIKDEVKKETPKKKTTRKTKVKKGS